MSLSTPREKRQIFVIMPFSGTPTRTRDDLTAFFEFNLKRAIESNASLKYQYIVRRSDDTFDITAQIIRDIYNADIVLCDLSGHNANPNVMYELGIRLALSNRPVILFREASPDNSRIFDIAGFYAEEYRLQQYGKLEAYIAAKLEKFESGQETYESPVLKILQTEPTVVRELDRRKLMQLLEAVGHDLTGMRRLIGGVLVEFLAKHEKKHDFKKPWELFVYLNENVEELNSLPWDAVAFKPQTPPPLQALLTGYPMDSLIPVAVERRVNTFVHEYYYRFFASDHNWQPFSLVYAVAFLGESHILDRVLQYCRILATGELADQHQEVIGSVNVLLGDSKLVGADSDEPLGTDSGIAANEP